MIRQLFCAALIPLLAAACSTALGSPGDAQPRYDGLYRTTQASVFLNQPIWTYIRFYPDGEVIEASTSGTPETMHGWFNRKGGNLPHGKVSIKGNHISFSTRMLQVTMDFSGEIQGGKLHLDSFGHYGGHRETNDYEFIEWQDEQ